MISATQSARARYTETRRKIIEAFGELLSDCGMSYDRPERYINDTQLRNGYIRQTYCDGRQRGVKSEALIYQLADEFCLSYESVSTIVHNKKSLI